MPRSRTKTLSRFFFFSFLIITTLLCCLSSKLRQRAVVNAAGNESMRVSREDHQNNFERDSLLMSPSPRDYAELYKFACANNTQRVSRKELFERYNISANDNSASSSIIGAFDATTTSAGSRDKTRLQMLVSNWNAERECRRELTAWRYEYLNEDDAKNGFGMLIRDSSLDERAANVLYMSRIIGPFSFDMLTYNWGNQQVDRENMERVAGPRVNDELCGFQLKQMLALIEDLTRTVDAIRRDILENEKKVMLQDHVSNLTTTSKLVQGEEDEFEDSKLSIRAKNKSKLSDGHISLARILDSFGRYDSGLLFGKTHSPGSYHQCIWSKLVLESKVNDYARISSSASRSKIDMRFCWAHLSYKENLDKELRARKRTRFETPDLDVLFSGICIPEACHSKSYLKYPEEFKALVNSQFKLPTSMFVQENLNVSSIYCLVDSDSKFKEIPLFGKLLLTAILLWCTLVLWATFFRNKDNNKKLRQPLIELTRKENKEFSKIIKSISEDEGVTATATETTCFLDHLDIRNSWRDFMTAYASKSADDKRSPSSKRQARDAELDTINIIKVLGCAFVVLGHTMALYIGRTMDSVRAIKYIETEPSVTLVLCGTVVVDTFFVIAGILWSYFALKRLNKKQKVEQEECHQECSKISELTELSNILNQNKNKNKKKKKKKEMMRNLKQKPTMRNNNFYCDNGNDKQEREREQNKWRNFWLTWLSLSSYRYFRVVPLYVLIHWLRKYVFIYAGSGPFWDHGLNERTMAGSCHKESFLTPFTFLAAFYPISRQCLFPAWSIANDIYFALLAPPIIILMSKRARLAGVLSIVSCSLILIYAYYQLFEVPTFVDEELRELRSHGYLRFFDHVSHFYTAPHYRIFCFLAGVWAGYFLHAAQLDLDRRRKQRALEIEIMRSLKVVDSSTADKEQVVVRKRRLSASLPNQTTAANNNCNKALGELQLQRDEEEEKEEEEEEEETLDEKDELQHATSFLRTFESTKEPIETILCDAAAAASTPISLRDKKPEQVVDEEVVSAMRIEWPSWMRNFATWASFSYIALVVYVFVRPETFRYYTDPHYRIFASQFATTARMAWACANAILFLRMMTDWRHCTLMRLSLSKFWQIFTKLNYSMLLIHLDLIIYTIEGAPSLPNSFTRWGFFELGAGVFLICIPLSLFLHIVFENPINRLIKSCLSD